MRSLALIAVAIMLCCPLATAEPLTVSQIKQAIPGVWGWTGDDPQLRDHACGANPMKIWLEENGTVYKSQQVKGGKIYISKIGLPAAIDGHEPTYLMISYLNHPQRGAFGRQVVWALAMPDRDSFTWQAVPLGRIMPKLERCDRQKVG